MILNIPHPAVLGHENQPQNKYINILDIFVFVRYNSIVCYLEEII